MSSDRLWDLRTLALSLPYNKKLPRIVSCLVLRGRVISYGFNSFKTHPFQKRYGRNEHACHWHSEVNCIYNALKLGYTKEDLKNSSLYVCRVKRVRVGPTTLDRFGLAKPCEGCQRCIEEYGIKSVTYSCEEV